MKKLILFLCTLISVSLFCGTSLFAAEVYHYDEPLIAQYMELGQEALDSEQPFHVAYGFFGLVAQSDSPFASQAQEQVALIEKKLEETVYQDFSPDSEDASSAEQELSKALKKLRNTLSEFQAIESRLVRVPDHLFYILNIEVTQELYLSAMDANPSEFIGLEYPVDSVNFYDCIQFCNNLSRKHGLQEAYKIEDGVVSCQFDANGYRLPYANEWQIAARGGQDYKLSGSNIPEEVCWSKNNSSKAPHPAGIKKPNSLGLYDMSGNVEEICWAGQNGHQPVCGGSYRNDVKDTRISHVTMHDMDERSNSFGFRIVRTVSDQERQATEEANNARVREVVNNLAFMTEVGFSILKTEVTQKLYELVMFDNPSYYSGDLKPVDKVSFYNACEFCNKLNEIMGFGRVYDFDSEGLMWNQDAYGFRLPTRDEWIYAAKGGNDYKYSGSNRIDRVAWHRGNSDYESHDVGIKKENGYGLYDMSGNVGEFVWDGVNDEDDFLDYETGVFVMGGGCKSGSEDTLVNSSSYYEDWFSPVEDAGFRIVQGTQSKIAKSYARKEASARKTLASARERRKAIPDVEIEKLPFRWDELWYNPRSGVFVDGRLTDDYYFRLSVDIPVIFYSLGFYFDTASGTSIGLRRPLTTVGGTVTFSQTLPLIDHKPEDLFFFGIRLYDQLAFGWDIDYGNSDVSNILGLELLMRLTNGYWGMDLFTLGVQYKTRYLNTLNPKKEFAISLSVTGPVFGLIGKMLSEENDEKN